MKQLTREQLAGRKAKASRFVYTVLGDAKRAREIHDEPLEHYAQRRHITLVNPSEKGGIMATKLELEARVEELEQENADLSDRLDEVASIVAVEADDADVEADDVDGDADGVDDDDEDADE